MKRAAGLTALVLLAGLGWLPEGSAAAHPSVTLSAERVSDQVFYQVSDQVAIRGVVAAGVETGCLLLVADPDDINAENSPFLLLGGDSETIVTGAHLLVMGELVSGVMSPCKQGKPLRVSFVRQLPA